MDLSGLAGILDAIAWPVTAAVGLLAFRKPIAGAFSEAKSRITGVSVGSISVELAAASELKPNWPKLETDVRRLTGSDIFDSATHSLFDQISNAQHADFSVIDLGSGESWLSSRLYAFAVLLGQMRRVRVFVFVQTSGSARNQFVGVARPEDIRRQLAQHSPWLEAAYLSSRSQDLLDNSHQSTLADLEELGDNQPHRLSDIVRKFISELQSPPQVFPPETDDWLEFDDKASGISIWEHTKWLDGDGVEEILGASLSREHYTHDPDEASEAATARVLRRSGEFVAVLDDRGQFSRLIDRAALLNDLSPQMATRLSA